MTRFLPRLLPVLCVLAGCMKFDAPRPTATGSSGGSTETLVAARQGFQTKLVRSAFDNEPVPAPPPNVFSLVQYDSAVGPLKAYVSPDPGDGAKHPAIVWITGGDCNSIGELWEPAPPDNDQTAAAYRNAGIVMMFPSLRGGNDNPGRREGFLGEVDDVIAAADHLAKRPYVDPARIYLGGHSTGGTLVLLTAECTGRFRAVFAFGPVDDVAGYGAEYLPFDASDDREVDLRSPVLWLASISSPVFVVEGARQGNVDSLRTLARTSQNPLLRCVEVPGADHFDVLAPANAVLAQKILQDTGPDCGITLDANDIGAQLRR